MPTRLALARRPSLHILVAPVLSALTGAGCSQSLFDSDPGKDQFAGENDAGKNDAGENDAAPVSECPEPCAGDAVSDFAGSQGGQNGRWSYLLDRNEVNGAGYDELTFGTWNELEAWVGEGDRPVIALCRAGAPECAGLAGFLLLVQVEASGRRPAISFRLPEDATYQMSGSVRVADGQATDVPVDLIVSRAGRHDALAARTIRTSTEAQPLDARFPGLAGDEITVSIGSDQASPPIGVRIFLTRVDDGPAAFPGSCQLAVRFDGADALVDGCREATIADLNDGIGPPGTSSAGPGPSDRLGEGRVFGEGQFLTLGSSALDYDGDFTIQFWAQIQEPPGAISALYADWNSAVNRGLVFFPYDDSSQIDVCRIDPRSTGNPVDAICLSGTRPTDSGWHFWRLVRSIEDEYLRLCIDGIEIVQAPLPGNVALTSDEPPRLGRNVVYNPATFTGSFDEVRVFSEALPCPSN